MEPPEQTEPPVEMSDAEHLRVFLQDRDVNCPLCGYNLHGLTSDRCPECGRELRLSVGLPEPSMRAWVALAVPTCASAGLGVHAWAVVCLYGWHTGSYFGLGYFVGIYFLLSPAIAAVVIMTRRRFARLSIARQWGIAAITCLATGIAMASFVSNLIDG